MRGPKMSAKKKKEVYTKKFIEEEGRFEVFFQDYKKFLTKAAAEMYEENIDESEEDQDEKIVARLRAYPKGNNLPDLFALDTFTVNGQNYTIQKIYWGYKDWVKEEVFGVLRGRKLSRACTVAFVILE